MLDTPLTDHQSVALGISKGIHAEFFNKSVVKIDFDNLDIAVSKVNFKAVLDINDINTATELLINSLSLVIQQNTKSTIIPNRRRVNKPWISPAILRCMKNRDNLFKKTKSDPNNETLKVTYKRYRNFCTTLIKKAKREYEKKEIANAGKNNKKLWDAVKKFSGSYKVINNSLSLLSSENPENSTNAINNYFAGIGKHLAEKNANTNPNTSNKQCNRTTTVPNNSLVLLPTDELEVFNLIKELRDNCAVGSDLISTKFLKRYINYLTPPITHICNLSISSGVFPAAFKTALIKPVYKNGDKGNITNYRPISILPALSKILEKIINKQLVRFLEKYNLLAHTQYGFRHGKSTDDAVSDLINEIVTNLDSKKKCLAIFLDLAKAFDTVSVPHLLQKMEGIGIRGVPLQLFTSYLSHRKQKVKIDQWLSNEIPVDYGVPQGSIIGPILFLIYINDLCQLELINGRIFSYADDTALFFWSNSWDETFETAQIGFNKVCSWLQENLLTLNVTKTNYLPFAVKSNLLPSTSFNILAHSCDSKVSSCSCTSLQRNTNVRYLGVILDNLVNFKPHIDLLVLRLRKIIYIFKTLRYIANLHVIKMVYTALCQSLIEYCIVSWGGTYKTSLIEVERAQRTILKVAAGLPFRYSTLDLYKKWDVLSVRKIFILQTVIKKHSLLTFKINTTTDKRRKGTVSPMAALNTKLSHRFFCYLGSFLYNKLNNVLEIYPLTKKCLKRLVSNYLKSLSYEETESFMVPLT